MKWTGQHGEYAILYVVWGIWLLGMTIGLVAIAVSAR